MDNIPTELLRTLVAVVDLRSYTRAAQSLGVTQPAVSAQIKRLQSLLGTELFDKTGPGISLTPKGAIVVTYARRMLSINDLILHVAEPGPAAQSVAIGVPGEFIGRRLPELLANCRRRWPNLRFDVRTGGLDAHLADIHQGHLDVAVGLSMEPEPDARHAWFEDTVWLRGKANRFDPLAPVPLATHRENCIYHRVAVEALNRVERDYELVFTAPNTASLCEAVRAGLGVMVLVRSRTIGTGLSAWDDAPLPKLPKLCWGIYVREGGHREAIENIADALASILLPQRTAAE